MAKPDLPWRHLRLLKINQSKVNIGTTRTAIKLTEIMFDTLTEIEKSSVWPADQLEVLNEILEWVLREADGTNENEVGLCLGNGYFHMK